MMNFVVCFLLLLLTVKAFQIGCLFTRVLVTVMSPSSSKKRDAPKTTNETLDYSRSMQTVTFPQKLRARATFWAATRSPICKRPINVAGRSIILELSEAGPWGHPPVHVVRLANLHQLAARTNVGHWENQVAWCPWSPHYAASNHGLSSDTWQQTPRPVFGTCGSSTSASPALPRSQRDVRNMELTIPSTMLPPGENMQPFSLAY